MRRLALGLALLLLAATPAGADIVDRKQSVDARIAALQDRVAAAQEKETALQGEIDAVSGQIRGLEQQVGDVSSRLVPLEQELRLREVKLDRLNALYEVQSDRLSFLRDEYRIAIVRLNRRLVTAYESNPPDELSVLLSSRSFSAFLDGVDYIKLVARRDRQIADEVRSSRDEVAGALARTKAARNDMLRQAKIVAVRVRQARALREQLLASRGLLVEAQSRKKADLASLSAREQAEAGEIDSLQQVSAQLAAKIQAAQSHSSVQHTGSGALAWPVSAPITSSFGWRWGRMHEGIDLGAAYGTPITAAAAGTVIYAGWLGGYGNLTVIDHGGGLATAYGHQSGIAVSLGQQVAQGEVIGYVGSTGHSTGPHLHFEVRVNGQAVDPLGYL
ncbi:MAG TPA: peptidoglycan DD-metalloendopeptidase family protein [Gaiellaceae bacterium]|jgi:murein DD-endopeptidase MepM/ murein hydrolase activator NlpD